MPLQGRLDANPRDAYPLHEAVQMRTTLDLDDDLLRHAQEYAPDLNKTALLEEGLRSLVKLRAAQRLADAIGRQPDFELPPRRQIS